MVARSARFAGFTKKAWGAYVAAHDSEPVASHEQYITNKNGNLAVDLVDRTANGVALVWIYHLTTHDANYSKNLHSQKMHVANNPRVFREAREAGVFVRHEGGFRVAGI